MNYFTVKRRLRVLNEFKETYIEWYNTVQKTPEYRFDSGDHGLRSKVNKLIPETAEAVDYLGFGQYVSHPAPAVGGPIITFHLIDIIGNKNILSIAHSD